MKKSIILKSFIVILVSMMLVFVTSTVRAESASNSEYEDLFGNGANSTNNTSNKENSSNTNTSNTNSSNTNSNNTKNTNSNNIKKNTTNNENIKNTNNTSLPKTGIEDSLPTVVLVVVFGVSAVYAYKKIKDYRNID